MFKLYEGHAEENDSDSAEEGGEQDTELPTGIAAEVPAQFIVLDENARLEPDFDYDFS